MEDSVIVANRCPLRETQSPLMGSSAHCSEYSRLEGLWAWLFDRSLAFPEASSLLSPSPSAAGSRLLEPLTA